MEQRILDGVTRVVRLGALEWVWLLSGVACLGVAACALLRASFIERLETRLERLERSSLGRWIPRLLWGGVVPILLVFYKLAQYHSHELMLDTALFANLAWKAAHGLDMGSSLFGGTSYWSCHFAFTYALFSPILWLWESTTALILAHGLIFGSVPFAVYLLARCATGRPLFAWTAALLTISNPLFQEVFTVVLDDSVFALPFFVWAAYCWEAGYRKTALVSLFFVFSTREIVPFLFCGLGIYALLRSSDRKGRLIGATMLGASVLVWVGELALIRHAQRTGSALFDYWGLYGSLGSSPRAVLDTVVRRPWLFIIALFYPPIKLWNVAKVFFELAFLPLASGAAIIPAMVVWLPQQLALPQTDFHKLVGHHAAYAAGPLFWAAVIGLKRLSGPAAHRRSVATAFILLIAGRGFLVYPPRLLPPGLLPTAWNAHAPHALAMIPPGAKVWSDIYLTPQLAMRRYLKYLPNGDDAYFNTNLFVPDRVLLSTYWLAKSEPATRDRILGFLQRNKFRLIFKEEDLMVLANPAALP